MASVPRAILLAWIAIKNDIFNRIIEILNNYELKSILWAKFCNSLFSDNLKT